VSRLHSHKTDDYECALGLAWLGLSGGVLLLKKLREVGVRGVWEASWADLLRWGMSMSAARTFLEARRDFDPVKAGEMLESKEQRFISFGTPLYPPELLQLESPPAGLFVRGSVDAVERLLEVPRITVVGTRRATPEGEQAARVFTLAMIRCGIAVLSGLALGIDGCAHGAAIKSGGLTLAVLGCGADVVYPPRHRWLYERIIEKGVVASELPPGTHPMKWTFPHRNRLLAALADAVLVVEGSNTSGAMQTAKWSLGLGRQVFAIPGSIFKETSEGCNNLIRDGATPALQPDILVKEFLDATRMQRSGREPSECARVARGEQMVIQGSIVTDGPKALVLECLKQGPGSMDRLISLTGLPPREVAAALGELEVCGAVARAGPGVFLRAP
jgi:DNA processing protein